MKAKIFIADRGIRVWRFPLVRGFERTVVRGSLCHVCGFERNVGRYGDHLFGSGFALFLGKQGLFIKKRKPKKKKKEKNVK